MELTRPLIDSGRSFLRTTRTRFVVMDTGRTVGYCIILNSNMTEIAEGTATSQYQLDGPKWDALVTRCTAEIRDMAHT